MATEEQQQAPYRQVVDYFRGRILSGEMPPGSEVPPRREIAMQRGVARATVDKAMGILAAEGLIELNAPPKKARVVNVQRHSTAADRAATKRATGEALAKNETSKILSVGMIPAPEDVAHRLQVAPGTRVLHRKRVTFKDDRPAGMSVSYYPQEVADLTPELAVPQSIRGGSRELALERMGLALSDAQGNAEIVGRTAQDEERSALLLAPQAMILEVTRTVYVEDGRIVEVGVKVTPAHVKVNFRFRLD